jgi:hypothetical protein
MSFDKHTAIKLPHLTYANEGNGVQNEMINLKLKPYTEHLITVSLQLCLCNSYSSQ